MKRISALILLLALVFPLCACGAGKTEEHNEQQPYWAEETHMGYLPQKRPAPEGWENIRNITLDGNRIYTAGTMGTGKDGRSGAPAAITPWLGVFQIEEESWRQISLPEKAAGEFRSISAKEGLLWALLVDYGGEDYSFSLLQYSMDTDQVTIRPIGFAPAEGPIGYGFGGIAAIGNGLALLFDEKNNYVIDTEGNILKTLPLTEGDPRCRMERGGQLFARCTKDGQDGFACFDPETLTFTSFVPFNAQSTEPGQFSSYGEATSSRCESEGESLLLCGNDGLYRYDPSGGSTERLSPWTDLATEARDLNMSAEVILEAENGDLFFCSNGPYLIRLQLTEQRNKILLRFACCGNGQRYQDAILRFNNTNPDYKIEMVSIEPSDPDRRERFQREFAAGYAYDIIDTALLPGDGADASVLADLLPLIDSDGEYSREDFIQPILTGMMKDGGLYELIPSVAIMSLATSPDDTPGADGWTMENLADGKPLFSARWDREKLLDWLCLAASAEFVDWQSGTCSFDSLLFSSWLTLIKEGSIADDLDQAVLLSPQYNAAAGPWPYLDELEGSYIFSGLPGASSPGYFLRLNDLPGDQADEIRLGIAANSPHREAAWAFLRLFLRPEYADEIPVLRSSFEARLTERMENENTLSDLPPFTAEDGEKLRALVEASTKMIRDDPALRQIIHDEAADFLAGQREADEAAKLIQSRAAIYVAEHCG